MDIKTYLAQQLEGAEVYGELPSLLTPFTTFNIPVFTVANTTDDIEPSTIEEINEAPVESNSTDTNITNDEPADGGGQTGDSTSQVGKNEPKYMGAMYIYNEMRDEKLKNMMRGLYIACHIIGDDKPVELVTRLYSSVSKTDSLGHFSKILLDTEIDTMIFTCLNLMPNAVKNEVLKTYVKKNKLIINIMSTFTREVIEGANPIEIVVHLKKLDNPNINEALYRGFSQQYANVEMDKEPYTEFKALAMVSYLLDIHRYSIVKNKNINFEKIIKKVAVGPHRGVVAAIAGWALGGLLGDITASAHNTADVDIFVNNNFGYYFTGDMW